MTQPGTKSEAASAIRDSAGGMAAKLKAAVTSSTKSFVEQAAISDIYERDAARIALQRSSREDVKAFAQQMVEDHTETSGKLRAALQNMGAPISPPSALDGLHRTLIHDLEGAAKEDFDERYIAQQKTAHSGAITLFRHYAESGEDAPIRELAKNTLPVLEQHMRKVEQLSGS